MLNVFGRKFLLEIHVSVSCIYIWNGKCYVVSNFGVEVQKHFFQCFSIFKNLLNEIRLHRMLPIKTIWLSCTKVGFNRNEKLHKIAQFTHYPSFMSISNYINYNYFKHTKYSRAGPAIRSAYCLFSMKQFVE